MVTLKEHCELNISKTIDVVFERNNIETFLKLMSRFWLYDYKNQLLIWKQRPEAVRLAGENAWKAAGRTVLDSAKPLAILYPIIRNEDVGELYMENNEYVCDENTGVMFYKVEPKYATEYRPEVVFEESDTIGSTSDAEEYSLEEITNRIRYITDFVIREDEREFTQEVTKKGIFLPELKEFVVRPGMTQTELLTTLIQLFIDYEFYFADKESLHEVIDYEAEIKMFIQYVVLYHFSILREDFSLIFTVKISRLDHDMKEKIVQCVSYWSSVIIQDLSNYYLEFIETAIANSLIRTDKFEYLTIQFAKAAESIKDNYIKEAIYKFRDKLFFTPDGYLEKLYEDIQNKKLYTYPKRILEFDAKKYEN